MFSRWSFPLYAGVAVAQNVGTLKQEVHPTLTVQHCTKSDGCTTEERSVVIDANWRWTHATDGDSNCLKGDAWDSQLCPNAEECTRNCAIDGVGSEYESTYGVFADGAELKLAYVTHGQYSTNVGSRVYLLEEDNTYQVFKLKNKEFTFDVDVSNLPCGLNGALYFVAMDADGGMSRYPTNKAGAKYGTGYCDAQCPHDLKFINGEANCDDTGASGKYGTCCTEFDVWEANSMATAFTAHACNVTEQTRCEGTACGDGADERFDGVCDKNGCDFQTYRLGDEQFWGRGSDFVIDTTKTLRAVTQFITDDGTDSGNLVEVRRFYRQGDRVIHSPSLQVGGGGAFSSLSKDFCEAELQHFDDSTNFLEKGGFEATDLAFEQGMVLTLSLWDDYSAHMLWLDSTYPVDGTSPGDERGPCATTSGDPNNLEEQYPDAFVRYMNIKYGEIGTTDVGPIPAPSPSPPGPSQCSTSSSCMCSQGMQNHGTGMQDSLVARDASECCDLCNQQEGCVGWTFVPGSGNECWLKDSVGELTPDEYVISGSMTCAGGSLAACLGLCPSSDPTAFQICVGKCMSRCQDSSMETSLWV